MAVNNSQVPGRTVVVSVSVVLEGHVMPVSLWDLASSLWLRRLCQKCNLWLANLAFSAVED